MATVNRTFFAGIPELNCWMENYGIVDDSLIENTQRTVLKTEMTMGCIYCWDCENIRLQMQHKADVAADAKATQVTTIVGTLPGKLTV